MKRKYSFLWLSSIFVILFTVGITHAAINDGLVAHYPFDGSAVDASGNGHDGTVNGAALVSDRFGHPSSAYSFQGTQYVSLPSASTLLGSDPSAWSYSIWFKPTDLYRDYQAVFSDYYSQTGDVTYGMRLDISNTNKIQAGIRISNVTYEFLSSSFFTVGEWVHASVVVDKSQSKIKLYVNGQFEGEKTINASADYIEDVPISVGRIYYQGTTNYGFRGEIDDIRIYNRALSAEEAQGLYIAEYGNGPWSKVPSIPGIRYSHEVFEVNGKLYIIGGMGPGDVLTNVVYEFDPVAGTYIEKAPLPTVRGEFAAGVIDGKIYICGGNVGGYSSKVEAYDPASNTWTAKASLPAAMDNPTGAVVNGKLYVIGGFSGGYRNSVYEYDPVTNTWATKTAMPTARACMTSNVLGGKIYVIGGNSGSVTGLVEIYDPASNTWATGTALPTGHRYHTSSVVNNKIYVFGGYLPDASVVDDAFVYDPATGAWTRLDPMPDKRERSSSVVYDGKIYLFGGVLYTTQLTATATVNVFDPVYPDTDQDKMNDDWESTHFGDLSHNGTADTDGDGLTDQQEYTNGTNPNSNDTDADGMTDGWEVTNGLDPKADDALIDTDGDKFVNAREYQDGTAANDAGSHLDISAATGRVPDTGQTASYTATFGEDSDYLINPQAYIKMDAAGNFLPDSASSWAMVLDMISGLIWEVKTDDGSIHDKDNKYTWYSSDAATNGGNAGTAGTGTDTQDFIAALNAASFGGFSDWRLPTVRELAMLPDNGRSNPSIRIDFFPNNYSVGSYDPNNSWLFYWTASTSTGDPAYAWAVNFGAGNVHRVTKSSSSYVRAVRGDIQKRKNTFVDNGDGTVTDTTTGLMWQKGNSPSADNWTNALSYGANLVLAEFDDWRLPSRYEFQSLLDYERSGQAINTDFFPSAASGLYNTSTTNQDITSAKWYVNTADGLVNQGSDKSNPYYARCVRGGQPVIAGRLLITSPLQAATISVGETVPIQWNTLGLEGPVSITISRDGGNTYETIAAATENDGEHEWVVAGESSVNCMLKVEPVGDPSKGTVQGFFSIKAPYENGMVAYYPFNGNVVDATGNGHNGNASGAVLSLDRFGQTNSAYQFDGSNDVITVMDHSDFDFGTGDFSISFWCKFNGAGDDQILGKDTYSGTSAFKGFFFQHLQSGQIRFVTRDSQNSGSPQNALDSVATVLPNTWYHIAGARTGNVLTLYINGVMDRTLSEAIATDVSTGTTFKIGKFDDSTLWYMDGNIDDVRVYNRSLEASEVLELYNINNSFNQAPFVPSSPDPSNQSGGVILSQTLSWTGGDPDAEDTVTYDVYFGTESSPSLVVSGQSQTTHDPGTLNPNTTYYWKIVSKDDKGGVTTGPVWQFTTLNRAPYAPSDPTPGDAATGVQIDATLLWSGADPDSGDTLSYDIYAGTSETLTTPVASGLSVSQYAAPGGWTANTTYFWKVVAKDAHGGTTTGPVWQFTTLNHDPSASGTPSPNNSGTGIALDADLGWACTDPDPGDALTFDVYFGTAAAPPLMSSGQSGATFDPGPLAPNTTYYWKITAHDSNGGSSQSPVWSFATLNRNPDLPSAPNPSDSSVGVPLSITLTWTCNDPDAGDTVTYDVYFGTDSGQLSVISSPSSATYSPPQLSYNTDYYWKIVAKDDKGGVTEGPVWQFKTVNYPVAVLINLPSNTTRQTTTAIEVGGDGVESYSYRLDGGVWSAETGKAIPIGLSALADGAHTIDVRAKSSAGIWQPEANATTFNWTVDTVVPTVTAFTLNGGAEAAKNATVAVVAQASDNDGISRWLITETATVPTMEEMNAGSASAPVSYAIQSAGDGLKTLYLWVMDTAGNISAEASATITLDTVSSITIAGGNQCTAGTAILLSGTREAGATVVVNSVPTTTIGTVGYPDDATWTFTVSGLTMGSTEVTAIATDSLGNWASDSVTVRQSTPATAVINTGTGSLPADGTSTLLLNVSVEDSGHNPVCEGETFSVLTTLGSITPSEYTTSGGQFSCQLKASTALGKAGVTVKDGETPLGSAEVNMVAGGISKLVFTDAEGNALPQPVVIAVNTLTPEYIQVQTQDDYGHPVAVISDTTILLNSSFGVNMTFERFDGTQKTGQTSIVIPAGQNSSLFLFKSSQSGQTAITGAEYPSDPGWANATMEVLVGSTGPVAGLSGAPSGIVSTTSATVTVGGEGITAYKYKLDGGSWSAAEIPVATLVQLSGLSNGSHTLFVIGKNAAGTWQAEASATTATWTVDTTCVAELSGAPSGTVSTRDATITVSGADVVSYRYSIDGGAWSAETAVSVAISRTGLADGSHTLYVTGKNSGGIWQSQSAATTASWIVQPVTIPPDPRNLVVKEIKTDRIKLGWDLNPDVANTFHVYRSQTANGYYYKVSGEALGLLNLESGKVVFEDRNVTEGVTYFYKVRAFSGTSPSNGYSNIISATLSDPDHYEVRIERRGLVVSSGNTENYVITIVPREGFEGTVTVSCSGLPGTYFYGFNLPDGSKSSILSNLPLPVGLRLEVTAPANITQRQEHAFSLTSQNFWTGGSSAAKNHTLNLTVLPLDEKGIHVETDKSEMQKGEAVRIFGRIVPFYAPENTQVSVTVVNKGNSSVSATATPLTILGGYFEDKNLLKTLPPGEYEITASWTDDYSVLHTSLPRAVTVYQGQITLTCAHQPDPANDLPRPNAPYAIFGDTEPDMPYRPIKLFRIDPDDPNLVTQYTATTMENGGYSRTDNYFDRKGIWKFRAYWDGTTDYIGGESNLLYVPVGVDFGRVILLGGGTPSQTNTGWGVTKTLVGNAYRSFSKKGFTHDMIHLMINTDSIDLVAPFGTNDGDKVDELNPTKTKFLNALKGVGTTFGDDLNADTPLYVYMQGHGLDGGVFVINETLPVADGRVTAAEIDAALDELQSAKSCKVVLILEACFAGNFIQALSAPNRIIVTSAGNERYQPDTLGYQAFSRYLLMRFAGENDNLSAAFKKAKRDTFANLNGSPTAMLEDNGDGKIDDSDGYYASAMMLNPTFGVRPVIGSVTVPNVLEGATSAAITVDVTTGDVSTNKVWVQVVPPGATSGIDDLTYTYTEFQLVKVAGTADTWAGTLTGITKSGLYKLIVMAEDVDREVSDPSELYIQAEGEQVPGDVNGDSVIDIADAILALRVVSGMNPAGETVNLGADVDGDNQIGLREVFFILQKVAGLRAE